MSFNLCPFIKYNEECLKLLLKGANITENKMKCWIRNDIAHLIKSVSKWKCWQQTKDKKDVKQFYLMVIGYLTTIDDFETFVKVIARIFLPFKNYIFISDFPDSLHIFST